MKLQLCGVKVKRRKNYNTGQENGKDNQHHDRTARFNNNNNNPLVTTFGVFYGNVGRRETAPQITRIRPGVALRTRAVGTRDLIGLRTTYCR